MLRFANAIQIILDRMARSSLDDVVWSVESGSKGFPGVIKLRLMAFVGERRLMVTRAFPLSDLEKFAGEYWQYVVDRAFSEMEAAIL